MTDRGRLPGVRSVLVFVLIFFAACGDDASSGEVVSVAVGGCDGLLTTVPAETGSHVPVGTPIEWSTDPPATGTHFGAWAGWNRHYPRLDRGYYVHNAEHGGIVLLYNCPTGCQDVVDSLLDVARNAEPDPQCTGVVRNRIIVAADPLLPPDVQVAAVSWTTLYTASCFDPYVTTFTRNRYRRGPEDTCADGTPLNGSLIAP
ncbi:MAG: hypothetical protein JWP01_1890 [Myxococcales bacterium]|nr:hypothetical protein [Myxococcales bacterium]